MSLFEIIEDIADILRGIAGTRGDNGPYADLLRDLKHREPIDGFKDAIEKWEGTWQAQPQDVGNYVVDPEGRRHLVGTMRGVTPAAYALWKGKKPYEVTAEELHRGVTLAVAAEIGMKGYYRRPGFDRLPYVPATEVWCDVGWGSGPVFAVKRMQSMIGVAGDGVIGPRTAQAYADWLRTHGHDKAVEQIRIWRRAFYQRIAVGPKAIYLKGWLRRADWYRPDNAEWWSKWK